MANMERTKVCPVCGKPIKENQAITVCPQCGVAHHMECWEKNNGCFKRGCLAGGRHGISIEKIKEMQHTSRQERSPRSELPRHEKPRPETPRPRYIDPPRPEVQQAGAFNPSQPSSRSEAETEDIFMRCLIGSKKADYYGEKFSEMDRTGSKVSWNWMSFLFGAVWMVYRRMYLNTLLCWAIVILLSVLMLIPMVGFVLYLLSLIALYICMGLFGNALYKRHLEKKYFELKALPYECRIAESARQGGTSITAVAMYYLIGIPATTIVVSCIASLFAISVFGVYATNLLRELQNFI